MLGDNSHFYADELTVNPWMGIDTISPLLKLLKNKVVFVLLKTSNPGSNDIQSLKVNGESIFLKLSKLIKDNLPLNLGKSGYSNIGVVVGASGSSTSTSVR